MRALYFLILSLLPLSLLGQENLSELDTITDYKERFFEGDKSVTSDLVTYTRSLKIDGFLQNVKYNCSYAQLQAYMDTSDFEPNELKLQGFWREKLDKRGYITQKKRHKTYVLREYKDDLIMGKMYEFNKRDRLIKTSIPYPMINDSVLSGLQIIKYDKKGLIEEIEFTLFGVSHWDYTNKLEFHQNGKVKYWSVHYYNDSTSFSATEYYEKNGLCKGYIFENTQQNKSNSYLLRNTEDGIEEDFTIRENGYHTTEYRLNGKTNYFYRKKLRKSQMF